MKKTISAAVIALITSAFVLSACGEKTPVPIGTLPPEPVASSAEETETVPEDTDDAAGTAEDEEIPVTYDGFEFMKTEDGQTWIDSYSGKSTAVAIPPEDPSDGSPVTGIDVWAFRDNDTVRKIVVPDTVTTIEKNAFMYCTALEEIVLPGDLKTVGEQAFYRCSALKRITIPEGVETLGYATFMMCESLEEVTLPKSIKEVGDSVFSHCSALLTVNYRGTEEEWWDVSLAENAMPPTWYTMVYEYAG